MNKLKNTQHFKVAEGFVKSIWFMKTETFLWHIKIKEYASQIKLTLLNVKTSTLDISRTSNIHWDLFSNVVIHRKVEEK